MVPFHSLFAVLNHGKNFHHFMVAASTKPVQDASQEVCGSNLASGLGVCIVWNSPLNRGPGLINTCLQRITVSI